MAAAPFPAEVAADLGRRLHLVARRMNDAIYRQQFPAPFLAPLRRALRQPGKLLGRPVAVGHPLTDYDDTHLWALHVVLPHAAASGAAAAGAPMALWRGIAPVAAAAEFLGLAGDLADDLADGDGEIVAQLGAGTTLAVVIALLGLVHDALADPQVPAAARAHLHARFASAMLRAVGGQYLDQLYEHRPLVTIDEALQMTEQKSGSLIGLLFEAGAFVGALPGRGAAEATAIAAQFGRAGVCLGTAMQLWNDGHDAQPPPDDAPAPKSDRARAKKTPPLVMEGELRRDGVTDPATLRYALNTFTNSSAAIFQQQACDILEQAALAYDLSIDWLRWLISRDAR